MYLFVPSIPALSQLAAYAQQDSFPDAGCVTEGDATIKRLRDLESPPDKPKCGQWEASTRWKQLLEEVDPGRPDSARDVWAALRAGPESAFATPYGYLVAAQQDVMAVLADQKTISVREYWQRMRLSIGEIYLGMDRDPRPLEAERTDRDRDFERAVTAGRYQRESGHRNALLAAEQPQPAFDTARAVSLQVLAKWRSLGASALDLRGYADAVVAAMSEHWFGLPDGDLMMRGGEPNSSDDVHVPFHFLAPSRYIFPPAPTEFVTHLAHKHGRALLDRSREFVERVVAGRAPGQGAGRLLRGLFPELVDHPNAEEMDLVARTLVGVMHGFLPTTLGNFISVADQWIEGRTLWRLQMELQSQPGGDLWDVASRVLEKPLISAMQQRPVPDTLHRVTTSPTHIGNTAVPAGARIVLGIGSASRELAAQGSPSTAPIFGGDYAKAAAGEGPATAHPCPGRDMAMGTLTGMFSALLEFGSWAPHDFPLILSALPTPK